MAAKVMAGPALPHGGRNASPRPLAEIWINSGAAGLEPAPVMEDASTAGGSFTYYATVLVPYNTYFYKRKQYLIINLSKSLESENIEKQACALA